MVQNFVHPQYCSLLCGCSLVNGGLDKAQATFALEMRGKRVIATALDGFIDQLDAQQQPGPSLSLVPGGLPRETGNILLNSLLQNPSVSSHRVPRALLTRHVMHAFWNLPDSEAQ